MYYLFIILLFNLILPQLHWYNHSELNWKSIETENFIISFHDETQRRATEAAIVAEAVYEDITTLYNFEPDSKTRIINNPQVIRNAPEKLLMLKFPKLIPPTLITKSKDLFGIFFITQGGKIA